MGESPGSYRKFKLLLFTLRVADIVVNIMFEWRNDHQRRSVLFKYASRTANRGGSRPYYEPETYWDEEIVSGMTPEERAVMFGPTSAPKTQEVYLAVEPDGTVRLDN